MEFETDASDIVWVRVDRTRKLPATVLLRAVGLSSDDEIVEVFGKTSTYVTRWNATTQRMKKRH